MVEWTVFALLVFLLYCRAREKDERDQRKDPYNDRFHRHW